MQPKFLMSSTSSQRAQSQKSTHLLERRPFSKFISPKEDCDLPLSQDDSDSSKVSEKIETERECERINYNKIPVHQLVKMFEGDARITDSSRKISSLAQRFDPPSPLETKNDLITTKQGFYRCVDNISSLASMGQASTNAPSSQSKLKNVLNTRLKNPIQIDLKTYKGLTEVPRVGSVPNLKPILNRPQNKLSKMGAKQNLQKDVLQDQGFCKRVSFAENKILIFYNNSPMA